MSCQKYRNAFWVFQMKIESYGNRELMHMGKLELHTGEVHIWKLRWRELETFWEWHKPLLEKEEYSEGTVTFIRFILCRKNSGGKKVP